MIDAYYVPIKEIEKVEWTGDAATYDLALYNLGYNYSDFIIVNPAFPNFKFDANAVLPLVNSNRCIVWKYNDTWVAKYFKQEWIDEKKYWEADLELVWKKNPDIDIAFDIPTIEDLYDLNYEMVWHLDTRFNTVQDKVWVYKCKLSYCEVVGIKDMGHISPSNLRIVHNPDIPKMEYSTELTVPLYDLKYECVWYLDSKYNTGKDKVWAIKAKLRGGNKSVKDMGYVSPKLIYNPELPAIEYITDDHIPYVDLVYEHVWMIDEKLTNGLDDVWAAKILPANSKGTKVVGNIKIKLPEQLDVIFISYNEPNAEENWTRVKEKAPNAKRINGVKGIVAAHKRAAELATTDMFYVVDGDAYVADDFNFDFQPDLFNRDCVHVWQSINPVNDLVYGYGGVKLLPRELTLQVNEDNPDMTTSISNKFRVIKKVSNISAFNTSEFNTFRSAFRECAKLSSGILRRQLTRESKQRLDIWCTQGADRPYGEWAIKGSIAGKEFGDKYKDDSQMLSQINNLEKTIELFNNLKG